MSSMEWFRLYHEARNDRKLQKLNDSQFRVWFNLLCYASDQPKRGTILYKSDYLLALEVGNEDCDLLEDTLGKLAQFEIIEIESFSFRDDGMNAIHFCAWEKRQYNNPSDAPEATAERKRQQRERERNAGAASMSRPVTTCHDTYTDTDTEEIREDTDTDTESLPSEVCAPSALPAPARESLTRFVPPSVEEVEAFMNSPPLHQPACARPFHDYYTSVGWRRGKNPIKDWRAAARGWCSREAEKMTPNGAKANTTLQDLAEETHREREEMQRRGSWLGGSGNRPP